MGPGEESGWVVTSTVGATRGVSEFDVLQLIFADETWIKEDNCPHRTDLQSGTFVYSHL